MLFVRSDRDFWRCWDRGSDDCSEARLSRSKVAPLRLSFASLAFNSVIPDREERFRRDLSQLSHETVTRGAFLRPEPVPLSPEAEISLPYGCPSGLRRQSGATETFGAAETEEAKQCCSSPSFFRFLALEYNSELSPRWVKVSYSTMIAWSFVKIVLSRDGAQRRRRRNTKRGNLLLRARWFPIIACHNLLDQPISLPTYLFSQRSKRIHFL